MTKKPLKVIAGTPNHPLVIGDIEIPCYVLEDETRVFVQRGMAAGLGMSPGSGARIDRFTSTKGISRFVNKELRVVLNNPIKFVGPGGLSHGYPAQILVDLCRAVLDAQDAGVLHPSQARIANRASVLTRALATVGVIGLVDEATGYQRIRSERALATILEKFIAKDLQRWTKTFPYEFYEHIFRLKGWDGPVGHKRPAVIGHYTNDIVYSRLAPGVLDELKRKNPKLPSGRRRSTHQQWFTPEHGHPKLKEHLAAVTAIMRASPNWDVFQRYLARSFPKVGEMGELNIED